QRLPDSGGLAYWKDQLNQGLNRDAVLLAFMFSPEFQNFMDTALGVASQRAEVAFVVDVYRAALSRLGDSGGFQFYRDSMRSAQCQGRTAVANLAHDTLVNFFNSA